MLDCKHRRTVFIQSSRGSDGRENVSVCADCGEFRIFAEKDGVHFDTRFTLHSHESLIAASQWIAGGKRLVDLHKRTWKPLDFAGLRLYEVRVSWQRKGGGSGCDRYVVAADSPNQSPQSAANLIREMVKDQFELNPDTFPSWHVQGYALEVLQPLSWTENGINLFLRLGDEKLLEALRANHKWHCENDSDGFYVDSSLEEKNMEAIHILEKRLRELGSEV